jgi:quercetin dioxygenase-like cupin family protein
MHHVRQENLPFVGSSHEFVGAEQGDTSVSVFLFDGKPGPGGKPGSGPGPHRHPYDEIQFIREGRGVWTVDGKTFEGSAGDIFVIKAGEIHSFKAVGDSPLVQLDVHLNPRFIQENL